MRESCIPSLTLSLCHSVRVVSAVNLRITCNRQLIALLRFCSRTVDPAGSYVRLLASRMYERTPSRAHASQPTAAGSLEVRCPALYCMHWTGRHAAWHASYPQASTHHESSLTCAGPPAGWRRPSACQKLQCPLCPREHEQGAVISIHACVKV